MARIPQSLFGLDDLDAPAAARRATAATVLARSARRWPSGATESLARLLDTDPDPTVRAAALGALVRRARPGRALWAWQRAVRDTEPALRRTAAQLATRLSDPAPARAALCALSRDPDGLVGEAACFALGETAPPDGRARSEIVAVLAAQSGEHHDPLVREAAVAALGAIGDRRGRAAVLAACDDRPAVLRRAVLALAAFSGRDVDAAIRKALDDPDSQVRQAAEDLLAQ